MKGVAQTAHDAGVPVHFVRQLVKQNKISFVMAGKKALINWDGFLDYLERGDCNE
jgi:excisionase family DNA binding protein